MSLESFSGIFEWIAKKNPEFRARLEQEKLLLLWPEAVGKLISKHARATRIKGDTLFVECDHPVWKTELHFQKQKVLENLKTTFVKKGGDPSKFLIRELWLSAPFD